MAIPPFPSKDMAKLVLGYLMEEQLMTAYDEFLNESPYLDALRNEYDRVLMNSLRNILAEYRAVKIYVEGCKPLALRRRLFQCSNLLEVVKFLVQHIDVNDLQEPGRDRISYDSEKVTTSRIGCDVCHSLKLESCVCPNKKRNWSSSKLTNNSESIEAGRSTIQTTPLSELPGNQVLQNTSVQHQINQPRIINHQEIPQNYTVPRILNIEHNSICIPNLQIQSNPLITSTDKQNVSGNAALQCSQNIAEFNTVLNQVYNNSSIAGRQTTKDGVVCNQYASNNGTPVAGNFQDFTTGVRGAVTSNVNIPDSSTTEKINVPCPERYKNNRNRNEKVLQRKKCVFRLGNMKHDVTEICSEVIDVDSDDVPENLPNYTKQEDPKVTILSDVRVGNDDKLTVLPKNATSTPLLHMKTIYINNTPVYKPKPIEKKFTFTRDEIMAMPTIILVPASGPSIQSPTCGPPQTTFAPSSNVATSSCQIPPTTTTLPPLTVDVSNSLSNVEGNLPNLQGTQEVNVPDTFSKPDLVKKVEVLKNASVPKDNIVSGCSSASTPHMLPPERKSSSTPRRSSHVRVLDFTTPRRILNETINENPKHDTDSDKPVEVMISKSPNVTFPHNSMVVDNTGHSDTTSGIDQTNNTVLKTCEVNETAKNTSIKRKKSDWDADLRALVGPADRVLSKTKTQKSKHKRDKKTIEGKKTDNNKNTESNVEKSRKKSSKNNISRNNKHPKKTKNAEAVEKTEEKVPSPNVSPTGIVAPDKDTPRELKKVQNKSNDEEHIVTPEVERLSLRNEIGAKLNISDILETPYKQALYEIQMETPRCLGPDLQDDPMSDIKITDIPTPRFLSSNMAYTPKPTQPTPSSYSSRPTDYSSGGSYYKPDDQDYLPNLDDVACPVTSTHSKDNPKKNITEDKSETAVKENHPKDRVKRNRSRPVRQCTKNVSYYNNPVANKNTTDANNKEDISSCSDTASAFSSLDDIQRDNMATPNNDRKKTITTKSGGKKNHSLAKKRSPLKRSAQKPFMKIKPRRATPTKDSGRKSNKKSLDTSQLSLKGTSRVRNTGKDKCSGATSHVPAPTKSRRKSSTPRKLHCTKTFNSESSGHESPEATTKEKTQGTIQNSNVTCVQDSDTEQLPLRWSDDGSQDTRLQGEMESVDNETEDISKIKEYLIKTNPSALTEKHNHEGTLQSDLVERGFDRETAEKIERDLLNMPVPIDEQPNFQSNTDEIQNDRHLERSVESDCSTLATNLVINEEDSDDLEFTVHECNEDSTNYVFVQSDETKHPSEKEVLKLKDKFSMEVSIDEGVVIRMRAPPLHNLFELDTQDSGRFEEENKETEMAVSSISNMDRLYTPMKDPIRAQCYEIFDSTLTSIDTPLKADSPVRQPTSTVAEIIIEGEDVEEELEMKEKAEYRKRKRLHCSSTSEEPVNNENKKVKPETQFMLQTKDIKDIDIEVLLTKLHGS